jgi:hypothetical protein
MCERYTRYGKEFVGLLEIRAKNAAFYIRVQVKATILDRFLSNAEMIIQIQILFRVNELQ